MHLLRIVIERQFQKCAKNRKKILLRMRFELMRVAPVEV